MNTLPNPSPDEPAVVGVAEQNSSSQDLGQHTVSALFGAECEEDVVFRIICDNQHPNLGARKAAKEIVKRLSRSASKTLWSLKDLRAATKRAGDQISEFGHIVDPEIIAWLTDAEARADATISQADGALGRQDGPDHSLGMNQKDAPQ